MKLLRENLKLSSAGVVCLAVSAWLTLMADGAALFLAASDIRATSAAYGVYGVSVLLTLFTGIFVFVYYKAIKKLLLDAFTSIRPIVRIRKYDVFDKLFTDYGRRTLFVALGVLIWNVVYVSHLIWMAVAYRSSWFAALAGFYAWLTLMRGGVLLAEKFPALLAPEHANSVRYKHIVSLACGAALIIAGCAVSAPVIEMTNGTFPQRGSIATIVVNSVFAFLKCVPAVVQLIRVQKYNDPVTRSLKNISLVTALMSLLTLEMSVLTVFGDTRNMWQFFAVSGALVSSAIIAVGIVSVVRNSVAIRKFRRSDKARRAEDADKSVSDANDRPGHPKDGSDVGQE